MLRRARVRRTRKGTFRLDLAPEERSVLRNLFEQLASLVRGEGPVDERVRRLFPTAYANDAAADAEYQQLTHDDLVASRLAAVDTVLASIDATEIDADQLDAWMATLNGVRLVLGTMLSVDEDLDVLAVPDDDPDAEGYLLYGYLSGLLNDMVEAVL
jgi:Domain of unknown function (DUF2017)